MHQKLFIAIATLMGTIIGAGILGIPYVVAKAGFLTGVVDIIIIGVAVMVLNLYLGEVVLRTDGNHQLPGYALKYLGKWGKRLLAAAMVLGIYGALIAYIMGVGEALRAVLGSSAIVYSLLFFFIVAILVYRGLKTVGKSELVITSLVIAIIVLISAISLFSVKSSNLAEFHFSRLFVPYGVVLFAFWGSAAIPEVREMLARERKQVRTAILIGSLIPLFVYLLFALVVVGVIGAGGFYSLQPNERIATVALSLFIGGPVGIFANLFAVMAMTTSFLTLGTALKEMFSYDYGINEKLSYFFVMAVPLSVFLVNYYFSVTSFIGALEVAGVITGGIAGVIIVLMFWKAKQKGDRKPEYSLHSNKIAGILLMALFILGVLYEILTLSGVLRI